jgi:hypothetical protein
VSDECLASSPGLLATLTMRDSIKRSSDALVRPYESRREHQQVNRNCDDGAAVENEE